MIANNLNEFIETVSNAERKALNTAAGQKITKQLLEMKLKENPNMTKEEWQETKSQFMTFIFAMIMKEQPEMMKELGGHVYEELRK